MEQAGGRYRSSLRLVVPTVTPSDTTDIAAYRSGVSRPRSHTCGRFPPRVDRILTSDSDLIRHKQAEILDVRSGRWLDGRRSIAVKANDPNRYCTVTTGPSGVRAPLTIACSA